MTTVIAASTVSEIVITSFFVSQEEKCVVEHVFKSEVGNDVPASVIATWIPAFAENDGLEPLDYLGGYATVDGGMVAKGCNFNSSSDAEFYFDEDVSDYATLQDSTVGVKTVADIVAMTSANH